MGSQVRLQKCSRFMREVPRRVMYRCEGHPSPTPVSVSHVQDSPSHGVSTKKIHPWSSAEVQEPMSRVGGVAEHGRTHRDTPSMLVSYASIFRADSLLIWESFKKTMFNIQQYPRTTCYNLFLFVMLTQYVDRLSPLAAAVSCFHDLKRPKVNECDM